MTETLVSLRELKALDDLIDSGIDSLVRACERKRELSLRAQRELSRELKQQDLPEGWGTKHDREHLVWRANLYGRVPEKEFGEWLAHAKRNPSGFSENYIREKAQRWLEERKRADRAKVTLSVEGLELYEGDVRQVRALKLGPASAVITDPPYEHVALDEGLWSHLIRFASEVLVDHGWLVMMSGQRWLPEVFEQVTRAIWGSPMVYCWTLAVHTPGAESAQGWLPGGRNPLNTEWKPVMVYSKGMPTDWPSGFRDVVVSPKNEKEYHEHGQSVRVFEELVDKFSEPGSLVADPFLGGGTTGEAAHRLGRAFEGFDIAGVTETVRQRIQDVHRA